MSHLVFIAASYGVAIAGLGLLTLWLVLDYRSQRRALAELEARGVRRRARTAKAAQDDVALDGLTRKSLAKDSLAKDSGDAA